MSKLDGEMLDIKTLWDSYNYEFIIVILNIRID